MIYLAGGCPAVTPMQTPNVQPHRDGAARASGAPQGPRHSDPEVLRACHRPCSGLSHPPCSLPGRPAHLAAPVSAPSCLGFFCLDLCPCHSVSPNKPWTLSTSLWTPRKKVPAKKGSWWLTGFQLLETEPSSRFHTGASHANFGETPASSPTAPLHWVLPAEQPL